jgi:hypothetical protein
MRPSHLMQGADGSVLWRPRHKLAWVAARMSGGSS